MKTILSLTLLVMMLLSSVQSFAQVFDLSTGIDNSSGELLALLQNDDTWQVCLPGNTWTNPTSYIPVRCGSGNLENYGYPYKGKDPSVRWLSPYLNAAAEHSAESPLGFYYYKMSFNYTEQVQSASMCFDHIGADNIIDQIIINGNVHTVSYGFDPFSNNVCLTPEPAPSEFVLGVNEIVVRVNNTSTYTGIEMKGSLVLKPVKNTVEFDLSTGIDNVSGELQPILQNDDTWQVCLPGNPWTNPTSYIPVRCGSGNLEYFGYPYKGKDPTVRWISPYLNTAGEHTTAPAGYYYYKMSFTNTAQIQSASMCFNHIGADNIMDQVMINGNVHYVAYGFNPFSDSVCLTPQPTPSEFVSGTNEIIVRVNNVDSYTGMEINGKLVLKTVKNSTTTVEPTSTESMIALDIVPNPAKGVVSLDIRSAVGRDVEILSVCISDMNGKKVKSFEGVSLGNAKNHLLWDTGSVSKGCYMVLITTSDHKSITKKLIVE